MEKMMEETKKAAETTMRMGAILKEEYPEDISAYDFCIIMSALIAQCLAGEEYKVVKPILSWIGDRVEIHLKVSEKEE